MKIKKISIFLLSLLILLFLFAGVVVTVNAYPVDGIRKDTFSFVSTSSSLTNYGQNAGGVDSRSILYYNDNIELYYDLKAQSSKKKNVYEAISRITVKTNPLPKLPYGAGYHAVRESNLYVAIYKDGSLKESISRHLNEHSMTVIDMSSLNEKYGSYQFKIIFRYKVYYEWGIWYNENQHIECISDTFNVNTKDVSGYFTSKVYDTNKNIYTDKIENGGEYKTDNKNIFFKWQKANYDNTNDSLPVKCNIYDSNGQAILEAQNIYDGTKGINFQKYNNEKYTIILTNNLGKSVQYYLTFEESDSLLNIESSVQKDDIYCIEYKSKISWTSIDSIKKVQLNGKEIKNGDIIEVGATFNIEWGKEYNIILTKITDATEIYKIVFTNKEQVDLNTNQNSFQKSPIGRWYETHLSDTGEKIYNSWASYENALTFAIERENSTVTQAYYDGGAWIAGIGMDDPINKKEGYYYIYKQRNNPSEKNAYFSKEALDSSILGYAKASISNYTYATNKTPATPYAGEKIYKTIQEGENEYNLFLLSSITLSKLPYVDIFISYNGEEVEKVDFKGLNQITYSQNGIYKIQEINPFGDSVYYQVYIQNSAPIVEYEMKDNIGTQILTNATTRFGNYLDLILSQDLDDDSLLIIEKKGIGNTPQIYTYSELLKIRQQDKSNSNFLFNESGQYTITAVNHWTIYSKVVPNTYTFYVSINPPYINKPIIDEIKNELTLSFGVPAREYDTEITSVAIYKYNELNKSVETLSTDSKGNTISPSINSYIFNTKGVYIIVITDNFGRIKWDWKSFSRKKPTAILTIGSSEVVELDEQTNGYYNKRVKITWYDKTVTAKMYGVSYTWSQDGVMIKKNLNENYNSGTAITAEGYYIIELIDIDFNSRRFTFFIDQKAPTINLFAKDEEISSGAYKNTDVSAIYTPNSEYESPIRVNVKKDTFPISYPENGLFIEEGFYELTLIDFAGNSSSCHFTIDKTAPQGFLHLEDGSEFTNTGITNKKVYCTWSENDVTATCNDKVYYKGSLIENSQNNTKIYKIVLTDRAGNSSIYSFQISKDIPIIVIKTESGKVIANNETIEEAFTISWEDPNYTYTIEIIKNGKAQPYTNYTELSSRFFKFVESGAYRLTFKGGNGNIYIYQINAKMKPTATITAGIENLNPYDYTNKQVKITVSDRNATIEVFKLDSNNNYKTYSNWSINGFIFTIIEDGTYRILLTNDFNQENQYYFTIKTTLPKASFNDDKGNIIDISKEHIGNIIVSYNKDEITEYKVYKNGKIVYGNTNNLTEAGRYTIILTDKAGNQNIYNLSIIVSKNLNWAGIATLIILILAGIGISIFLFRKFRKPIKLK